MSVGFGRADLECGGGGGVESEGFVEVGLGALGEECGRRAGVGKG